VVFRPQLFLTAVALAAPIPAQAPVYAKGDVVRLVVRENGDSYPDSRIVAVASDHLRADKSALTVNNEIVTGVSPELLQMFAEPWDQVTPAGHYFVVAEQRNAPNSVVRYHGLIPAEKIVRKIFPQ
jgi:hypothetical protein